MSAPPRQRTQITAFHPVSGQILRLANSKIVRTVGSDSIGPTHIPVLLCPQYLTAGCPAGQTCVFLHAKITYGYVPPEKNGVHVKYILDVSSALYDMQPKGNMLKVFEPNLPDFKKVPSEYVLRTHGSDAFMANPLSRVKLQHCAHFYLKKVCNRGPTCNFIHVVDVDVDAMPGLTERMPQEGQILEYRYDPYSPDSPMVVMRRSI